MKILIIAAHPDDEVLGCGGTISRLAGEMKNVFVAILGEGITSRYSQREQVDRELIEELGNRSRQVSKLLGVKELFLFNLPDNRFDTLPLIDIIKNIEDLINRLEPGIIYTHHSGDLNIDHAITNRAVLTATRPVESCPVKELYTFEVPSSTEWAFNQFTPAFKPNVFVDISATLETKIQAMQIYESEIRHFPHPRSSQALRANAERWGSGVGLQAAEAFQLTRSIK
jgi:LmbE family N-acetylglucosaminyl deacetylase